MSLKLQSKTEFPEAPSAEIAPRSPSLAQALGVVVLSYIVFLLSLWLFGGHYWTMVSGKFGDNPSYLEAANAIRYWQFSGITVKQFWGVSYAMAAVSLVTRVSMPAALLIVCIGSSLVAIWLCHKLWGGWITAFFALLSFDWFQRTLIGGAEPLFIALLLGSFLALRRDRWLLASVLASLATVVRPFGIFALAGLAIHLLYRKRVRECAAATVMSLAIGALYTWPLLHYFGNPFANVSAYQRSDWHGGLPFSFPFWGILRNTFPLNAPTTNLVLTWGWILFVLAGIAVAVRSGDLRNYAIDHTAEACFVVLCFLALYSYDAPEWARSNFPRFALPMLPWTVFFLRRYLPEKRSVVVVLAFVTPTLAAASAVGIRNVAALLSGHH